MPSEAPLTVLIADDNGLLATALEGLLNAEESIEIVGRAGDGEEAARLAAELTPDVVLMDLSMPGIDGFEATRAFAPTLRRPRSSCSRGRRIARTSNGRARQAPPPT
jgi:DNA-binding NarL/FixJ family response regulator